MMEFLLLMKMEMLLESHLLLPNGALPKSFLVELGWLLLEWVSLIHPVFLNKYMDDGKINCL